MAITIIVFILVHDSLGAKVSLNKINPPSYLWLGPLPLTSHLSTDIDISTTPFLSSELC